MALIGVKNLHVAKVLKDTATEFKLGKPFKLASTIQISMTPKVAEATLYADDVVDEQANRLTGYDLSFNISQITAENEAKLLGRDTDENGGVSAGANDESPLWAVMFEMPISEKGGGGCQKRIIYVTKFQPYSEEFKTAGENLEFQTPTLSAKAMPRTKDNKIDYKLDIKKDAEPAIAEIGDAWYTTANGNYTPTP